jgi:hypothetical protein
MRVTGNRVDDEVPVGVRSYTQVLLTSSGPSASGRYLARNSAFSAVCPALGSNERVSCVTYRPDMSRPSFTPASPYTGNP